MGNVSNAIRFRDYQLDAIANIFTEFGVEPAGPDDDQIVAACRSRNGTRENGNHGRPGKKLADRPSDDVVAPF